MKVGEVASARRCVGCEDRVFVSSREQTDSVMGVQELLAEIGDDSGITVSKDLIVE